MIHELVAKYANEIKHELYQIRYAVFRLKEERDQLQNENKSLLAMCNKLDIIYDYFDSEFRAGNFSEIDECLKNMNVNKLSSSFMIGMLTASLPAKSHLASRPEFFNKVEKTLQERCEMEPYLLVGLD